MTFGWGLRPDCAESGRIYKEPVLREPVLREPTLKEPAFDEGR